MQRLIVLYKVRDVPGVQQRWCIYYSDEEANQDRHFSWQEIKRFWIEWEPSE